MANQFKTTATPMPLTFDNVYDIQWVIDDIQKEENDDKRNVLIQRLKTLFDTSTSIIDIGYENMKSTTPHRLKHIDGKLVDTRDRLIERNWNFTKAIRDISTDIYLSLLHLSVRSIQTQHHKYDMDPLGLIRDSQYGYYSDIRQGGISSDSSTKLFDPSTSPVLHDKELQYLTKLSNYISF